MPPLNEGSLLYMPTTLPGISITKAKELLQQTDKIIQSFPEVQHTLGKVGRAQTATDPAPLSMIETTITLWPHEVREQIPVKRFFLILAGMAQKSLFTWIWPEVREGKILHQWSKKKIKRFFLILAGMAQKNRSPSSGRKKRYITMDELTTRLNQAIHFPGVTNAWTMPIKDPYRHALHRHQDTRGDQDHGPEPSGSFGPGGQN